MNGVMFDVWYMYLVVDENHFATQSITADWSELY